MRRGAERAHLPAVDRPPLPPRACVPDYRYVTREQMIARYAAYLDVCNRHAWQDLAPFLADTVVVNGQARTRGEYAADLAELDETFPDYRWELRRAVVEGDWVAVHLRDFGTRTGTFRGVLGDGSQVETDEFDMYRFVDGLIHEVEGTADNARLTG